MENDKILERIELLRKKLNEIGKQKSLLDEEVIRISQQLDHLVNVYQKVLNLKKTWVTEDRPNWAVSSVTKGYKENSKVTFI